MRPLIWPQIATLALISAMLTSSALAQAPLAQQAPAAEELEGAPATQEQQTIPPIPVAIDPPPALPTPRVVVDMVWLEQPTAQDFARYYPDRAKYEGVSGRATMECLVNADGRLSCTIVSEEPEGWGFGEATLRIARHFRLAPETRSGIPTAGGRLRRTIRWVMQ
jgi:periplasmic protein TonB